MNPNFSASVSASASKSSGRKRLQDFTSDDAKDIIEGRAAQFLSTAHSSSAKEKETTTKIEKHRDFLATLNPDQNADVIGLERDLSRVEFLKTIFKIISVSSNGKVADLCNAEMVHHLQGASKEDIEATAAQMQFKTEQYATITNQSQ